MFRLIGCTVHPQYTYMVVKAVKPKAAPVNLVHEARMHINKALVLR
jgi:hypothetical protein